MQQDRRVVKAFISWLKENDPPDVPEGTDQSHPDCFKLFVLGSTSITILWSSVSDYSTEKSEHFQLGHGEIDSHHLIYSARLITKALSPPFFSLMQLTLKEAIVLRLNGRRWNRQGRPSKKDLGGNIKDNDSLRSSVVWRKARVHVVELC